MNASSPGDTVLVHSGTYPQVTLTRQVAGAGVRIVAASPDVTVSGFHVSGGGGYVISGFKTNGESRLDDDAHNITLDRLRCSLGGGESAGSCVYVHDSAHDIVVKRSSLRGGFDGVKFYGCPGRVWAHNVVLRSNDIAGASEDDVHVNCARNVTIEHNYIHDPTDNSDHNDGVQSQASDNLQIVGNRFSFTSTSQRGGPNQAIIIGADVSLPSNLVTHTRIVNNLVAHWNPGVPLIIAGASDTQVVNNTLVDSGEADTDPTLIISWQAGAANGWYQNRDVQIWNNILTGVYVEPGAIGPSYCDANLLTHPDRRFCSKGSRHGNPKFQNTTTYELSPRSPARGVGIARAGTPRVDIAGVKRPSRPDLGVRQSGRK